MQAISATITMAIRCGVAMEQLCSAFSSMSDRLVGKKRGGTPYMGNFRNIEPKLTAHGHDYVLANRGRSTNCGWMAGITLEGPQITLELLQSSSVVRT